MKNKLFKALIVATIALPLSACQPPIKTKEIAPYIFETETYKSLDYDYADKYYAETYDNWGGGCSAFAKKLDDGHMIVGRNMDLNISKKAAYIVRTECKDKYKTFGLAYTFRKISPDYDEVKKFGISSKFSKLLPFMCDDVMNEKGLYIEINMRNAEFWPAGQDKFACSGTNKKSDRRIYMFEIPRYVAENCATVDEAVIFLKNSNIYSQEGYWNYSFIMADATGNYGLVEIALNNVFWEPFEAIQTNFYVQEELNFIQDTKSGLGRYNVLKQGSRDVKTKSDMLDLMKKVTYFQFYDPKNCKFDPRSENIGTFAGATSEFIMNDEYYDLIMALLEDFAAPIRQLTREELMEANEYWETTFNEVADCTEMSIFVRFFENDNLQYVVNFDGVTKVDGIN